MVCMLADTSARYSIHPLSCHECIHLHGQTCARDLKALQATMLRSSWARACEWIKSRHNKGWKMVRQVLLKFRRLSLRWGIVKGKARQATQGKHSAMQYSVRLRSRKGGYHQCEDQEEKNACKCPSPSHCFLQSCSSLLQDPYFAAKSVTAPGISPQPACVMRLLGGTMSRCAFSPE
jgi:hypothetical protein